MDRREREQLDRWLTRSDDGDDEPHDGPPIDDTPPDVVEEVIGTRPPLRCISGVVLTADGCPILAACNRASR
jgi:hypothetical protein